MGELYHIHQLSLFSKTCAQCKQDKPFEQFRPVPTYADGHSKRCKNCEKTKPDREMLYHLYVDEQWLTGQIAEHLGMSKTVVLKHLKKYGIPLERVIRCAICNTEIVATTHNRKHCEVCRHELTKASQRTAYQKKADYYKAQVKEYRTVNREVVLAKKHATYHKNIEAIRAKDRARYQREKERHHTYRIRRYKENREQILAQMSERYASNPHPKRLKAIEWRKNNPDKARNLSRIKRVRARNAEGTHTIAQFWEVCERHQWACAYCGASLNKGTATEDHMTPISRGGSDWIDNIIPACRSCNSRKNAKTYDEYMRLIRPNFLTRPQDAV